MTPHEQMTQWDKDGVTYWIAWLMIGDKAETCELDVISHSEKWLQIRIDGHMKWINFDYVASIRFETQ